MAYRILGEVTAVFPPVPKLDENSKPLKDDKGRVKLTAPALQIGGRDGIRLLCDADAELPIAGSQVDVVARRDSWQGADKKWSGVMKLSMILRVTAPPGSRRVNDDGEILDY